MLSESNQDQCSVVPAQVPSDDEPELVLGDRQGRQAVVVVEPTQTRRTFRPAVPKRCRHKCGNIRY